MRDQKRSILSQRCNGPPRLFRQLIPTAQAEGILEVGLRAEGLAFSADHRTALQGQGLTARVGEAAGIVRIGCNQKALGIDMAADKADQARLEAMLRQPSHSSRVMIDDADIGMTRSRAGFDEMTNVMEKRGKDHLVIGVRIAGQLSALQRVRQL